MVRKRSINPDIIPKETTTANDSKNEEKNTIKPVSLVGLFKYASKWDIIIIWFGLSTIVITAICQVFNMILMGDLTGEMIDYVDGKHGEDAERRCREYLKKYALLNTLLGVVTFTFTYLQMQAFNYTSLKQIHRISTDFIRSALNQDISWYDTQKSSVVSNILIEEIGKLEDGIGDKFVTTFHIIFVMVANLVNALIRGWQLALAVVALFPIIVLITKIVAIISSKYTMTETDAYSLGGNIVKEVFGSIKTVLAFGGEQKEHKLYTEQLVIARNHNIKRQFLFGIGFGLGWFISYINYAIAFAYGIYLVTREKYFEPDTISYTPSTLITIFFGMLVVSTNLTALSPYFEVISAAKSAAAQIFKVIENKPIINACKTTGLVVPDLKSNIEFRKVHFSYPSRPDVKILNGLSFTVKEGETVALVGSSGSGKSTCIQLIQRFYDTNEGEIYIGKFNIKDLNLSVLRGKIGVVGQEPVLFAETIAENIRYGNCKASRYEIETAAIKANAHNFIQILPEQYETFVGEQASNLSGGQKQRIAIARALVKEPMILLLDEATSALDSASEAKVQAALDKVSKDCTTIIVAHRLSTIRNADRIIVLKEGEVVEEGTHAELMLRKEYYYNLVNTQVDTSSLEVEKDSLVSSTTNLDDDSTVYIGNSNNNEEEDGIEDDAGQQRNRRSLRNIMSLNRLEWKEITVACISCFILGSTYPLFAVLYGEMIGILELSDHGEITQETETLCVYFLLAGFVAGLATFSQIYFFGIAGENLTMRVRGDLFKNMLRQEMAWYDRKSNGVGSLCSKLSGDAAAIQGATGQRIGIIIQSITMLVFSAVLSLYYNYKIGLVALVFTPIIVISIFMQKRIMKREAVVSRTAFHTSTMIALEGIDNIRTVASMAAEDKFLERVSLEVTPIHTLSVRNTHCRSLVIGFARSVNFFAFAAANFYGCSLVIEEGLELPVIIKITNAIIMSAIAFSNALAFAPNIQRGLLAAEKVLELLDRVPQIKDSSKADITKWKSGTINYNNINFAYPSRNNVPILSNFTLNIPRGLNIALVGSSGSGKSTIIQLLQRYYDPDQGSVTLDQTNIRSIKLARLRSHLGIVSQEPHLFNRTIGENIAYGDNSRQVTEIEVIKAAKEANIHSFIAALPLGYNTMLGDKATQLSGGQKQRIAIARALVRKPEVLLLDEATSALDIESEKLMQASLVNAKKTRTCITIAHRLLTIQDADVICVINRGKIVEVGTHEELVNKRGLYSQMYHLQNVRN